MKKPMQIGTFVWTGTLGLVGLVVGAAASAMSGAGIAGIALSTAGFIALFLAGPLCFAVWLWAKSKAADYQVQPYLGDAPSPSGGAAPGVGRLNHFDR